MTTMHDAHPAALAPLDKLAWLASADYFEERGDDVRAYCCRSVADALPLDAFTRAYIEAALDDVQTYGPGDGHEMGELADVSWQTLGECVAECADFLAGHSEGGETPADMLAADMGAGGRDFYLTRNRHGAGFWDGRWIAPDCSHLTRWAHTYGTFQLYRGDDGAIYHHG